MVKYPGFGGFLAGTSISSGRALLTHGYNRGTSKQFDRKNNVEQVVMHTAGKGDVSITVRAYRAATASQSFALVFSAAF